jgi:dihydrofolate reductase
LSGVSTVTADGRAHQERDERIDMPPVVVQMGVTIDGFVHGAKGYEDWGLPPEDDEVVGWKVASLREAGTHIMGRTTYEAMSAVWPNETGVYADVMNEIPKVVFSSTLTRADWAESRIASGDLAEDIDRLKQEPGGIILAQAERVPRRPLNGIHKPSSKRRDQSPSLRRTAGEPQRGRVARERHINDGAPSLERPEGTAGLGPTAETPKTRDQSLMPGALGVLRRP